MKSTGVVVVAGPKFCNKTTTAKVFSKSFYSLDTKEKIELCQTDPKGVLVGEKPRLIDEWQNVPDLWNAARSKIDESDNKFGQFIFTGSSTPADKDDIYHSGAGGIVTVKMKPFSLLESKESDGSISLKSLFDGQEGVFNTNDNYSINDPKSFGLFFEDFAVKELSIYADYLSGEVRHYRDSNGLECDSIVHLENGDYALIEIKLGGERLINEGISNLKKLSSKLKKDKKHLPSFMAILTASGPAYTKDGIHIIPINLLGI